MKNSPHLPKPSERTSAVKKCIKHYTDRRIKLLDSVSSDKSDSFIAKKICSIALQSDCLTGNGDWLYKATSGKEQKRCKEIYMSLHDLLIKV